MRPKAQWCALLSVGTHPGPADNLRPLCTDAVRRCRCPVADRLGETPAARTAVTASLRARFTRNAADDRFRITSPPQGQHPSRPSPRGDRTASPKSAQHSRRSRRAAMPARSQRCTGMRAAPTVSVAVDAALGKAARCARRWPEGAGAASGERYEEGSRHPTRVSCHSPPDLQALHRHIIR